MMLMRGRSRERGVARSPEVQRAGEPTVLVVSTPHQLLNGVEAVLHFGLEPDTLFILNAGYSMASFEPALHQLSWRRIYHLGDRESRGQRFKGVPMGARFVRKWLSLQMRLRARAVGRVRTIIVGRFDHEVHVAFARALRGSVDRIIVVDDGTSSLQIDALSDRRRERSVLAGCGASDVILFTQFLVVGRSSKLKIVRHDYGHVNKRARSRPFSDETWLVGQPLVEDGALAEGDYLALMEQAVSSFNRPWVYFPHPRERYYDRVAAHLDVMVRHPPSILEFAFLEAAEWPARVVGPPSTALFSIHTLSSGTVSVHVIGAKEAERYGAAPSLYDEVLARDRMHALEPT